MQILEEMKDIRNAGGTNVGYQQIRTPKNKNLNKIVNNAFIERKNMFPRNPVFKNIGI